MLTELSDPHFIQLYPVFVDLGMDLSYLVCLVVVNNW